LVAIIDLREYPFLASLKEIIELRWPGLRLSDVLSSEESRPRRRALYVLKKIINKGFVPPSNEIVEYEVIAFYALLTIAKLLQDKRLVSRIAVAYAKHARIKLQKEPINNLMMIGNMLGLEVVIGQRHPKIPSEIKKGSIIYIVKPFSLPLRTFLIYSSRLARDPKYSLVNQIVWKGRVYLEKQVYVRLLEEAIAKKILEIYDKINPDPSEYQGLLSEAKKILEETEWLQKRIVAQEIEEKTTGVIDFESFPPCMKLILDKLRAGENLSHQERFTFAAFLARIGMDVDSILDLFKTTPDFNEKIARYQIEHIAGLRGSKKQYMPYSCQTMKSLGLCPIDGGCGAKNPLVVYKKTVWRKMIGKNKNRYHGNKEKKQ